MLNAPKSASEAQCSNVWLLLGVTVSPVDETTYQIFAPSQLAMDEAKEIIDELLSEEVRFAVVALLSATFHKNVKTRLSCLAEG